jgi:hypothetical protein
LNREFFRFCPISAVLAPRTARQINRLSANSRGGVNGNIFPVKPAEPGISDGSQAWIEKPQEIHPSKSDKNVIQPMARILPRQLGLYEAD